jgi:hypothetical protein
MGIGTVPARSCSRTMSSKDGSVLTSHGHALLDGSVDQVVTNGRPQVIHDGSDHRHAVSLRLRLFHQSLPFLFLNKELHSYRCA